MDGTNPHDARLQSAHVVAGQPGNGLHVQFFEHALGYDEHKGRSIGRLRAVPSRDGSALGEHRLESCQAFWRRITPHAFIGVDYVGALLAFFLVVEVDLIDGDGGDARGEFTGVNGGCSALVTLECEGVLVFTRDAKIFRDGFSREAHSPIPIGVGFCYSCVGDDAPTAEGDGGHRFNATGKNAIGDACMDLGRRDGDGLQPRCAVPIDGHAWHFFSVQSHQADHAANVQSLLCFWRGIANDDVVDAFAVKLREI